jgi:radical SAM superfamily enzyme YgiQ (UPF0313 family)
MSAISRMANLWVGLHTGINGALSRRLCHGFYDGRNLQSFRDKNGEVPVLFAIPAMSDVNGALPHPGVRVLQTILRHAGTRCEVLNYNLPVIHPADPFEHLAAAIRAWDVKILGVSTYCQAMRSTLEGLQRIKREFPHLRIVLGGPHPTESYLSLMGIRFIDYVCRGESEVSFPELVRLLLAGEDPEPESIPGVYQLDRATNDVRGTSAPFIDLDAFDADDLLRYHFSKDEQKQQRLYRGCHGTSGAEYWPIALVRGCPYDCTFCAAYQMSGKKLRYRKVEKVVDDIEFYLAQYGRRHFSFIDDAFTQHYEYVVDLCNELIRRGLKVCWTTDNGIRYETLGKGRILEKYLQKKGVQSAEDLVRLMIRAGWRGTAIGVESGSSRVRTDLVRKGGANLTNAEIISNLQNLKRISVEEKVYFYINGFLMGGFPELPLPSGKVIPAETDEEMQQTYDFAMQLRDSQAIDMMNISMVIPLPGTDMWDCLDIQRKMRVLLGCVPADHPEKEITEQIRQRILTQFPDADKTRYNAAPESAFWKEIYALSDDAQIRVTQSYDAFNADSSHTIDIDRSDPDALWRYRERVVEDFYGGIGMKLRMLKHVVKRSSSLHDIAAYLTLLGRKYDPSAK